MTCEASALSTSIINVRERLTGRVITVSGLLEMDANAGLMPRLLW
jgi:hypothetical protein